MSINYEVLKHISGEFPSLRQRSVVDDAEEVTAAAPPSTLQPADEMLHLVNQVFLASNSNSPRIVAFSGIESESMSWSVCARAAKLLAQQSSRSVCVIDGNVNSRKLSAFYSETRNSSLEWQTTNLRDQCIAIGHNLWQASAEVITEDGARMLPLTTIQERIAALRKMFYYVLIDTPGLKGSEGASVLTQIAGAVILVVEANVTRKRDAGKAVQVLRAGGVRLLGTILNNRECPVPKGLYSRL